MSLPIEVVFASPTQQCLIPLNVTVGTTIRQAILQSHILEHCPEIDLDTMAVGIFGEVKTLDEPVEAKDRIEIYRPLSNDPKDLRKKRAEVNPRHLTKRQKHLRQTSTPRKEK